MVNAKKPNEESTDGQRSACDPNDGYVMANDTESKICHKTNFFITGGLSFMMPTWVQEMMTSSASVVLLNDGVCYLTGIAGATIRAMGLLPDT